jgi:hypothetical protein
MGESSQTIIVSLGHNINRRSAAYLFQYTYIAISPLWLFTNNSKKWWACPTATKFDSFGSFKSITFTSDRWQMGSPATRSHLVIFTSDRWQMGSPTEN